jgi:hypothetical protein
MAEFLGTFAMHLLKIAVSHVMSVRLSVWMEESDFHWLSAVKYYFQDFY